MYKRRRLYRRINTILNIVILAVFCTGAILLCRNLISPKPVIPSDRPSVMTGRLVQKSANPIKSLENQTPPDTASEQPIETYGLNLSNDVYPLTEPRKVISDYIESDVDLLARLIIAEMGSDWVPDQLPLAVGSVVLNRIESDLFPDTLYDVIYQREPVLQYAPVANGHINNTPTERIYNVARFLLENGSVLPANVLYQSESIQGGIYFQYTDSVLQTTTYFCTP